MQGAGDEGATELLGPEFEDRRRNEKVTKERILAPHLAATIGKCAERRPVVVAHDTTEFSFEGREELGYLSGERRGFIAHFALAVSLGEQREPLGVCISRQ